MSSGVLCNEDLPSWNGPDCENPVPLDGGYQFVVIADGDIETTSATPITDPSIKAQWTAALDAGNVIIVGGVVGEKAEATSSTKKLTSRTPASVTNQTHTVTFQDYNTSKDNIDAWTQLMENAPSRVFGFITAHGWPGSAKFHGWASSAALTVSRVVEANNEDGSILWSGNVSWNKLGALTQYNLADIRQGIDF